MAITAPTAFHLLHILSIVSTACGFGLPPSSPHFRQTSHALRATRHDDTLAIIAGGANNQSRSSRIVKSSLSTASSKNNFYSNGISSNVNKSSGRNQYTQFFKDSVLVGIERTSSNSRRISGEMIMNVPVDLVWGILTDYDNLSTHVPNLVESRVINSGSSNSKNNDSGGRRRRKDSATTSSPPRVYQRGAQRIFGFEFGADVTMDMVERVHHLDASLSSVEGGERGGEPMIRRQRVLDFECVDSQFFSEFDGSWIVEEYRDENITSDEDDDDDTVITIVRYVVDVRPKGPVPVAALEWRIKEDVPVNILAVSKAATAAMIRQQKQRQQQRRSPTTTVPPKQDVSPSSFQRNRQQQPIQSSTSPAATTSKTRRSLFQPLQPIQRLTNQVATNLKQTAKSVLPAPVYSTAKQALDMINYHYYNDDGIRRRRQRNHVDDDVVDDDGVVAAPAMSLQTTGNIISASKENKSTGSGSSSGISSGSSSRSASSNGIDDVDWYVDETMAMYL